ncbi:hypothetical protein FGG08_000839 [Glutinoglossum americanum]|uniref:Yeast cell wall synthesis Kre9/Knh1-like N-terminal domain-containing protein n=1 Tax=Glutinoglossum americanum TaxID=1670608 RepID=A0A9P8L0V4_9PEZI|nr:hypothetical protein FGG08_000839 [Glutinoglossum americanum]
MQPVTLILRAGDPGNLATVETITTLPASGSGGSYSWIPSKDLPSLSGYAVEIKQGGLDNFSGQFSISGGSGSALPSGSATLTSPSNSTATTTSSSSSSSSTSTSSGNLTTTTTTLKTTSSTAGYTKTVAAPTGSSTVAPNANTAAGFASPLALVLGAVMAMIYFN